MVCGAKIYHENENYTLNGRTDGHAGWMNGWMDGWMKGRMDIWMDGWIGGQRVGWIKLNSRLILTKGPAGIFSDQCAIPERFHLSFLSLLLEGLHFSPLPFSL